MKIDDLKPGMMLVNKPTPSAVEELYVILGIREGKYVEGKYVNVFVINPYMSGRPNSQEWLAESCLDDRVVCEMK